MRFLRGLGACLAAALLVTMAGARMIAAQEAQPAAPGPSIPSIFIVGDSTANIHGDPDISTRRRVGWGTPFAAYFNPAKIHVVNAARAGRSSRTFMNEGIWAAVLQQLKPGDFVLIQFGHNDPGPVASGKERGSLPGIGNETQTVTHQDGTTEVVHTFGW